MADGQKIVLKFAAPDALAKLIADGTDEGIGDAAVILENAYKDYAFAHRKGRVAVVRGGTNARSVAAGKTAQGVHFTQTNSGYGFWIEKGTSKRFASPTFIPAITLSTPAMAEAIAGSPIPDADLTRGRPARIIK